MDEIKKRRVNPLRDIRKAIDAFELLIKNADLEELRVKLKEIEAELESEREEV